MDKNWMGTIFGSGSIDMGTIGNNSFLYYMVMLWIAFLSGLFITFLYNHFYRSRATGSLVHYAFPLMSISIAAIFICIQFSLPLSLGLLGALSIVRFRTPIKEPEEVGFILLVIATSLCAATFNIRFLALVLFIAVVALYIMKWDKGLLKGKGQQGICVITLPINDYHAKQEQFHKALKTWFVNGKIDSITEQEDTIHVSHGFTTLKDQDAMQLRSELNSNFKKAKCQIYFNSTQEL